MVMFLAVLPSCVSADSFVPALAYQCFEDADYFYARSVTLHFSGPVPTSEVGLFIQDKSSADLPEVVAVCEVDGHEIELVQTVQNMPRASGGPCAGASWARYDLWVDDVLLVDISSGCAPMNLALQEYGARLCSGIDETNCQSVFWREVLSSEFRPFWGSLFQTFGRMDPRDKNERVQDQ